MSRYRQYCSMSSLVMYWLKAVASGFMDLSSFSAAENWSMFQPGLSPTTRLLPATVWMVKLSAVR